MRRWAVSATPKTPPELLLPKQPRSGCSQGAKASGCCSLWHSAVLVVQVWGVWVPGECLAHPFFPHPFSPAGRWNPRCPRLGDASTLAVPAPRQCLQHCPHRRRTALGHSVPNEHVSVKRGKLHGAGRTPALRVPLLAEAVPAAWQGAGRGCCHTSAAPRAAPGLVLWFAHVVGAQGGCRGDSAAGQGAEVSSRTPGRAAVAWRGAGAAGGCSGCP